MTACFFKEWPSLTLTASLDHSRRLEPDSQIQIRNGPKKETIMEPKSVANQITQGDNPCWRTHLKIIKILSVMLGCE